MTKVSAFSQPKPFYLIFVMEIWERFGFYGVQALLVLFMVKQLGYSDDLADGVFAAYAALVYLLPSIGGYIGDNILGTKRTMVLGTIVLALGYGMLAAHGTNSHIFLPLAIIAVGNGLFKANPASLLSKVYVHAKLNPDSGFTLYYMAINIGSFFSMIISPIISHRYGWGWGFFISCLGLIIALFSYASLRNLVKDYGSMPDFAPLNFKKLLAVLLGTVILVLICDQLLEHRAIMATILTVAMAGLLIFYLHQMKLAKLEERPGMLMFIILFFQAVVFFVLYFQMPTSLNLYALRNINHDFFGITIQPASFQALNPLWIIILSPFLANIHQGLSDRKRDFSTAAKFALGTFLAGISFIVLVVGGFFAHQGIVSNWWLVTSYFFQSVGELLVSALGLAMVTRYIPARLTGFAMGIWLMSTAIAGMLAGFVAGFADIPKDVTDPTLSLPIYNHLFLQIGLGTIIVSLIMFAFIPMLRRLEAK